MMHCRTLIDDDIHKFNSLDLDKCLYEISRAEQTDDSVALQDGVDHMTIGSLANDVTFIMCRNPKSSQMHIKKARLVLNYTPPL